MKQSVWAKGVDSTPTQNSENLATSGGVYSAINDIPTMLGRYIQYGKISNGTLAASDSTDFNINFGTTMTGTPTVIASLSVRRSTYDVYINTIQNVSSTGFTLQLRNLSSSEVSLTSNRYVSWIAICL